MLGCLERVPVLEEASQYMLRTAVVNEAGERTAHNHKLLLPVVDTNMSHCSLASLMYLG